MTGCVDCAREATHDAVHPADGSVEAVCETHAAGRHATGWDVYARGAGS